MKESFKPGTMVYPLPAALISCGRTQEDKNVFTASWVGTLCSEPPMCYVSIRPTRHSYEIIKKYGEFVINLTTEDLAKATDWCGVKSGRDFDKFAEMGLKAEPTKVIDSFCVGQSPLSIECKVKEVIPLGSHDMFMADVVNVLADKQYINPETGAFELDKSKIIAYNHGHYYKIGDEIGKFGWTVQKNK